MAERIEKINSNEIQVEKDVVRKNRYYKNRLEEQKIELLANVAAIDRLLTKF